MRNNTNIIPYTAAIALLTVALLLLAWKLERDHRLDYARQASRFESRFYYTLCADSQRVADFDRLSDIYRFLGKDSLRLDTLHRGLSHESRELDYYLRVHGVQDEGYDMIAHFAQYVSQQRDSIGRLLSFIHRIDSGLPYSLQHNVYYHGRRPVVVRHDQRTDSTGIYTGEMDSLRRAEGHGSLLSPDGAYYEGAWHNGMRHGFGFSAAPFKPLRVGEWQEDRYLGERLNYTSERIYGIDISRYQHEQGRKRYAIRWDRLRVTHLGTISKKRVQGTVDYPVSFVYIKSTEGTTVRNKYFASDYAAARSHGIRVGAYHFFSTRTPAAAQAQYFLKYSRYQRGDFPPVLDVEPSATQIKEMGGTAALFSRIRTWLSIVARQTNTRPILYVSQSFVNRYLIEAPDIKRDYRVWIARYGEYKPDVKLVIWQLCPDGRVNGIQTPVDINVFNGYGDRYEEFLNGLDK